MYLHDSFARLVEFRRRHGFWATIRRVFTSVDRFLRSNRTVLFYCDISAVPLYEGNSTSVVTIEQKRSRSDLSVQDLIRLEDAWNPRIMQRLMEERFQRGAALWLAKFEGELAGYGWTLDAGTMVPHYFPLGCNDVHLFDFHVLVEYRGKRVNPSLVGHILNKLVEERKSRAFIEVEEWNYAQLSSLRRTPFLSFGVASKRRVLGRNLIIWSVMSPTPTVLVEDSK